MLWLEAKVFKERKDEIRICLATTGFQAFDNDLHGDQGVPGIRSGDQDLHGNQGVPSNRPGRSGHTRDRIGNVDHEIGQSVKQQQLPSKLLGTHQKTAFSKFCWPLKREEN